MNEQDDMPTDEAGKIDYGFKATLGRVILEREKQGRAMIDDLDMPLLERFFIAGVRFAPTLEPQAQLRGPRFWHTQDFICPKCGCRKFQSGPTGGLCQNIRCENGHCWNTGPGDHLEDIGENKDGVPGCTCNKVQS